jgi:serine protease SohB
MEFIQDLGLFTSKLFIIVIAIGLLAGLIIFLIQKGQKLKAQLDIEILNDHYDEIEWNLKHVVLSEKSLKEELKKNKEKHKKELETRDAKKRVYVLNFEGDIKAHASEHLREEITTLMTIARPQDEVVLKLESGGGLVHSYGFCASQLSRLRKAEIPLTVCVDRVAASGGYMMACVANKVLAAPFAIIGSIGVLAQVPNLHKLLKKHDVDYKEYTSGEYKRTVSFLGEITPAGEKKFTEQLNETHTLFKQFVKENRPQVELEKIATGEYWYGRHALDLNLVDQLATSDDYLLAQKNSALILKISFKAKKTISEKISEALGLATTKAIESAINNLNQIKW